MDLLNHLLQQEKKDKNTILCIDNGNSVNNNEYRLYSLDELLNRVEQFRVELSENNVAEQGNRYFALFMSNSLDSLCLLIALSVLRCSVVLLPPNLKKNEVDALLGRAKVCSIIVPNNIGVSILDEDISRTVLSNKRYSVYNTRYDVNRIESVTKEPTVCQLTSGSTSPSSKISIRTWSAVIEEALVVKKQLKYQTNDVVLVNSAISHSYGLVGGILSSLLSGSLIILPLVMDHLNLMKEYCPMITMMFGIRNSYHWLIDNKVPKSIDVNHLRIAMCAGSSIPQTVAVKLREKTGIVLCSNYGTTETGTITIDITNYNHNNLLNTQQQIDHTTKVHLGPILPHLKYKFEPTEIGQDELILKSSCISIGYINSESIDLATDNDGWFHTKDHVVPANDNSNQHQQQITYFYHHRIRYLRNLKTNQLIDPYLVEKNVLLEFKNQILDVVLTEIQGQFKIHITISDKLSNFENTLNQLTIYITTNFPNIQPFSISIEEVLPYSPAGKLLLKYL
eukprot:gene5676-7064_t